MRLLSVVFFIPLVSSFKRFEQIFVTRAHLSQWLKSGKDKMVGSIRTLLFDEQSKLSPITLGFHALVIPGWGYKEA